MTYKKKNLIKKHKESLNNLDIEEKKKYILEYFPSYVCQRCWINLKY